MDFLVSLCDDYLLSIELCVTILSLAHPTRAARAIFRIGQDERLTAHYLAMRKEQDRIVSDIQPEGRATSP